MMQYSHAYQAVTILLEQEDYETAIALLETALKDNQETTTIYWILGLAYLLNGQEEPAQSYWTEGILENFADFSAGVNTLTGFLKEQVIKFTNKQKLKSALAIWEQILILDGSDLTAHLHWIDLADQLNQFSLENLAVLGTIEILHEQQNPVDSFLLLKDVQKVLQYPTALSLDFLEASIPYLQAIDWLSPVMNLVNHLAYDRQLFNYAVNIATIVLHLQEDNLYVLNDLLKYYELKGDQVGILNTAKRLKNLLDTRDFEPELTVYLLSKLLSACIKTNDWSEVESLSQQLQHSLNALLNTPNVTLDQFLSGRFWAIGFPLLYLTDNPPVIRRYLNQVADIFQSNLTAQEKGENVTFTPVTINNNTTLKRIGYITHTLRKHSVGWLSRWLFKYHDRQRYEIYVYLIGQGEDELTQEWIYPNVDHYYHFERDQEAIIKQIQTDKIQILVDLDILTHNLTAQVLAHKPAPVQVSWLGSDASGLPAIDYFVVDPYVVPFDAQDYYREKLWCLPETYLAVDGFEVGTPTLSRAQLGLAEDTVIYLSVQNKIKSNPRILRLQLQIVQAVPNSIFLIKGGGDNELIREIVEQLAQEIKLDPNRVKFLPRDIDEMTHRANLALADVALDTYPYNGATTTLETLWMGVPLVTRVGEQFASRNSYAFLTQVGIQEGIAWTDEQYVAWGVRLGQVRNLREQVRERLRLARKTSPLWQGERFTREMEQAFCGMWEKYCEGIQRQQ